MDPQELQTILMQFETMLIENGYADAVAGVRDLAQPSIVHVRTTASRNQRVDDEPSAEDLTSRLSLLCDIVEVSVSADASIVQHLDEFRESASYRSQLTSEDSFIEYSIPSDYPSDAQADRIFQPLSSRVHDETETAAVLSDIQSLREALDLPDRPDLRFVPGVDAR